MPVNSTHEDYAGAMVAWMRAREVLAGEDAIKSAGPRYLPRLDTQTDDEFANYVKRASFFNATARTAEGYAGLIFRRAPFIKMADPATPTERALAAFANNADMLGSTFTAYARQVVNEVIAVGRAGTLIDWEGELENRVYASFYSAESILNWRVERINGRNIPTMVVLFEGGRVPAAERDGDAFKMEARDRIRVVRLVEGDARGNAATSTTSGGRRDYSCLVEIWQQVDEGRRSRRENWKLMETHVPLRLGKPVPFLPFVFHGPRHSQPAVDKLPLADVMAVNLDHYRLDADYKHGMHFTALPTAWVSGFDKTGTLRIGSGTAWVTETTGASAGFLEYTGQGLTTFERAMDRDERLMAVLGARLLEDQKRVGEAAQAIELRQAGENSILGNLAQSVSASLTQVLRWAHWWHSQEASPEDVGDDQVLVQLNTDFSTKGLTAGEIQAVVAAWQSGAISRDTLLHNFRTGEILPPDRTNEQELELIRKEPPPPNVVPMLQPAGHDERTGK